MISIHAPIVGCDSGSSHYRTGKNTISIHAPIVGCDVTQIGLYYVMVKFQSTHPSWGATVNNMAVNMLLLISIHAPIVGCDMDIIDFECTEEISIHAPIVGCDNTIILFSCQHNNFNPRTHRGVRPCSIFPLMPFAEDFNPRTHRGVRQEITL